MKVKTLGKRENPAVLMIPGMFCTSDMPEGIARLLADDFFFVLFEQSERRRSRFEQQAVIINTAHHFTLTIDHIFAHHGTSRDPLDRGQLLQNELQITLLR